MDRQDAANHRGTCQTEWLDTQGFPRLGVKGLRQDLQSRTKAWNVS